MSDLKRKASAAVHGSSSINQPSKKVKIASFSEPPKPSLGHESYEIESSKDWNKLFSNFYQAENRPAMARVNVPYLNRKGESKDFEFSLSFSEAPKDKRSQVKLNPRFTTTGFQDIYYSKKNPKFIKKSNEDSSDDDGEPKKKARSKIALDDFESVNDVKFAKSTLRFMKGTANELGLSTAKEHVEKRAAIAAGLIMTSERGRNPLNAIDASIELYKVKHGKEKLSSIFDFDKGGFVAARSKGAEKSRKKVTPKSLEKKMVSGDMRDIFQSHAINKASHSTKVFEEWVNYKIEKLDKRFKVK